MGRYSQGEHVKFEARDDQSNESEWMWLLVDRSDDDNEVVFGKLDSQPVVMTHMQLGQELAVSYGNIRERRKFD